MNFFPIGRRSFFLGAPLAAAAAVLPAAGATVAPLTQYQVSPELLALIEAHKRAWDAYGDTIDGSDPNSGTYAGEEGKRRNASAMAHEEACLVEVAVYRSTGPADDRAKGAYFRDMPAEFDVYSDKIIARLLNA